ncbi:DUF1428 domain-containing protein [Candidatus Parcubacteria bacterium]|nr:DUF1428 domain-containing protein [Candidatus Parcubacteria bacterium]
MKKGGYVDGFVLAVPKKNRAMYKKMSATMAKVSKKYGALDYKECVADDMHPKGMGKMKIMQFPKMAKAKAGEEVWFSYIVYKSRKHRDQVNKKIMNDPVMKDPKWKDMPMPFDMKRMAYGGFKVVISI